MSSPRARPARAARQPAGELPEASTLTVDAVKLAATLEKYLADGRADAISKEALQALIAAGCKAYAARLEAGHDMLPFTARSGVSPTDVMVTASGLLRAVNLAVFELGMWQSWTGR